MTILVWTLQFVFLLWPGRLRVRRTRARAFPLAKEPCFLSLFLTMSCCGVKVKQCSTGMQSTSDKSLRETGTALSFLWTRHDFPSVQWAGRECRASGRSFQRSSRLQRLQANALSGLACHPRHDSELSWISPVNAGLTCSHSTSAGERLI